MLEEKISSTITEKDATTVAVEVLSRVCPVGVELEDGSENTFDCYVLQVKEGQRQLWRKIKTLKRLQDTSAV